MPLRHGGCLCLMRLSAGWLGLCIRGANEADTAPPISAAVIEGGRKSALKLHLPPQPEFVHLVKHQGFKLWLMVRVKMEAWNPRQPFLKENPDFLSGQ
jgi:hypothetical protein